VQLANLTWDLEDSVRLFVSTSILCVAVEIYPHSILMNLGKVTFKLNEQIKIKKQRSVNHDRINNSNH